jgi:hypothetical protein
MSYCKRDGKDKAIFVTKEDGSDPVNLHSLIEEEENVIELSDGSINWDCPCLGGMAKGSCGEEFKKAFSCFHYCRGDEDKYVDCIPQFRAMQVSLRIRENKRDSYIFRNVLRNIQTNMECLMKRMTIMMMMKNMQI